MRFINANYITLHYEIDVVESYKENIEADLYEDSKSLGKKEKNNVKRLNLPGNEFNNNNMIILLGFPCEFPLGKGIEKRVHNLITQFGT